MKRRIALWLIAALLLSMIPAMAFAKNVPCTECGGGGEVNCDGCDGNGYFTCMNCGGTGKVNCDGCEGKGYSTCMECGGTGCSYCCETGYSTCMKCGGAGGEACPACNGGIIPCNRCSETGKAVCETCEGSGEVHEHDFEDKWSYDKDTHWHAATCEHKDARGDNRVHFDGDEDGVCDECGWKMKELPNPKKDPDKKEKCKKYNAYLKSVIKKVGQVWKDIAQKKAELAWKNISKKKACSDWKSIAKKNIIDIYLKTPKKNGFLK